MNRPQVLLTFDAAKNILEDADLVLFRSSGIVSRVIKTFSGGGRWSHIGMISYSSNIIELLEYRELKGSRAVNLRREVQKKPGRLDVFRCSPIMTQLKFNGRSIDVQQIELNKIAVVQCMRYLLGSSYDYSSIWEIAKRNIPLIRFFYQMNADDKLNSGNKFICSSSVSHCFTKSGFDIFPNKSDSSVTPNDYAVNPMLNYICTLVP